MHEAITDDPDVRQAIEDKIPDVAEIRDLVASGLKPDEHRKITRVKDLFDDLYLRAGRIGIEAHELIRLVSAAIDGNPQRSMRVSGKVTQPLLQAERAALHREAQAHQALTRAQDEAVAATRARHHAQSRCLAFGIEVVR